MKETLRGEIRARVAALGSSQRALRSRAVCQRLRDLPVLQGARAILGYYPLPREVDVRPFLVDAEESGGVVALPRLEGTTLVPRRWRPADPLESSSWGGWEPLASAPTLAVAPAVGVLAPGLAFDETGTRLGRGGGHYDRLLGGIVRKLRVGVAFDEQVVAEGLPTEPHDVALGWLVTPERTLRFQQED